MATISHSLGMLQLSPETETDVKISSFQCYGKYNNTMDQQGTSMHAKKHRAASSRIRNVNDHHYT
jgi:hypothetical protein